MILAAIDRREPAAAEGLDARERVALLDVAVAQLTVRVAARGHHCAARGEHGGVVATRGGANDFAPIAARARNLDPHAVLRRSTLPVLLGVLLLRVVVERANRLAVLRLCGIALLLPNRIGAPGGVVADAEPPSAPFPRWRRGEEEVFVRGVRGPLSRLRESLERALDRVALARHLVGV